MSNISLFFRISVILLLIDDVIDYCNSLTLLFVLYSYYFNYYCSFLLTNEVIDELSEESFLIYNTLPIEDPSLNVRFMD